MRARPRLTEAVGRPERDLAPTAASRAPAGLGLSHLVSDMGARIPLGGAHGDDVGHLVRVRVRVRVRVGVRVSAHRDDVRHLVRVRVRVRVGVRVGVRVRVRV